MLVDPCVERLNWFLGWGLDIEGEELAEGFPMEGQDSFNIICEGDLNIWDTSIMFAGLDPEEAN
jgi:hypothetical protein